MPINTSHSFKALTKTEKEILDFLWEYGKPLSASEIVNLYSNRTWKASYIHLAIQSMLDKKAIKVDGFKQTTKNYARTFSPVLTKEAFLVQEMVRDFHLNKDQIRKLMVYLVDSATDLETITSMLELCEIRNHKLS